MGNGEKKNTADLYRYGGLKGCKGLMKGFFFPGFKYTYILRIASRYGRRSFLGIIFRFILRHYSYKYGIQIPAGTVIGQGFYIGHFGTIVVSHGAIIGDNCNIAHNVTIGRTNRGKLEGTPIIGDKVWIGTGSVIVGKINIGRNVLIAPMSFVNFDVPNDSIVIGHPAKIIRDENATLGYINNVLNE
ncbi:MAG: serine acetyltransferase [Ginsengibacter sp.]